MFYTVYTVFEIQRSRSEDYSVIYLPSPCIHQIGHVPVTFNTGKTYETLPFGIKWVNQSVIYAQVFMIVCICFHFLPMITIVNVLMKLGIYSTLISGY